MDKRLNTWVFAFLASILFYLTCDFVFKESKNYLSLNYDWDNAKNIKTYENVVIDSVSDNFLHLITKEKLYLKPYNTFKITDNKKDYFFRFTYSIPNDNEIIFKNLIWINMIPKNKNKKLSLIEIDLPVKTTKGKSITTIGDGQIYQNEAKYFRKELRRLKRMNFFGDKKDIYGFNYVGNEDITYQYLKEHYLSFPKTAYYLIMIKPEINAEESYSILNEFVSKVAAEKIILMGVPIYENSPEYFISFNAKLANFSKENKKVLYIDSNLILKENSSFFRKSVNEISKKGYERLAWEVTKIL